MAKQVGMRGASDASGVRHSNQVTGSCFKMLSDNSRAVFGAIGVRLRGVQWVRRSCGGQAEGRRGQRRRGGIIGVGGVGE